MLSSPVHGSDASPAATFAIPSRLADVGDPAYDIVIRLPACRAVIVCKPAVDECAPDRKFGDRGCGGRIVVRQWVEDERISPSERRVDILRMGCESSLERIGGRGRIVEENAKAEDILLGEIRSCRPFVVE